MPPAPFGSEEWTLRALVARAGYAQSVSANVAILLQEAIADVNARLQQLGASDLANAARLQGFLSFAQSRLDEALGTTKAAAFRHLSEYAALESQVANAQLNQVTAALGLPPRALLIQTARLEQTLKGLEVGPGIGFDGWWDDFGRDLVKRYRREIRSGIVLGEGPRQIAARLVQSEQGKLSVEQFARSQVHMAVRSAVTGAQTEAALMEFREFKNVIEKVRFEAVLDQRTSATCRGLDDTVWDLDDPKLPKPPVHPNCRSTLVPIPSFKGTGIPGATAWQLIPGAKGSRVRYEDWLRKQPKSLQASILGDARAKLFQKGQLTLGQMIGKDLKPLSLEALQKVLLAPAPKPVTVAPAVKSAPKKPKGVQPFTATAQPSAVPGQSPTGAIQNVLNAANPATPAPGPLARYQALTHQQVGPQAGSNPGGVYVGTDGVKRYVKLYANQQQAFSEALSAQLYRDLGAIAPEIEIGVGPNGQTMVASRFIEGTKQLGLAPSQAQARKVLEHFIDDVFTANWDAVGLGGDNILVLKNGDLLRVDTGGTFHFRATGALKGGGKYNPSDLAELQVFVSGNKEYERIWKAAGYDPALFDFAPQVTRIIDLRRSVGGPGREGWVKYLDAKFGQTFRALPKAEQERFIDFLHLREEALRQAAKDRRAAIIDAMRQRGDTNADAWLTANEQKRLFEELDPIPPMGQPLPKPVPKPIPTGRPVDPANELHDDAEFELEGYQKSRFSQAHQRTTLAQSRQFSSKDLTADEQVAVRKYTGSWAYEINSELRSGSPPGMPKRLAQLQAVTRRYSLDDAVTLYRGGKTRDANVAAIKRAGEKGYQELVAQLDAMVGTEFTDPGFGSTSLIPQTARNFADTQHVKLKPPKGSKLEQAIGTSRIDTINVLYEIDAPKGMPGVAVEVSHQRFGMLTDNTGEYEFIVRDGMRYEVIGWQFRASGGFANMTVIVRLRPKP